MDEDEVLAEYLPTEEELKVLSPVQNKKLLF